MLKLPINRVKGQESRVKKVGSWKLGVGSVLLLFFFLTPLSTLRTVQAAISACSATANPSVVPANSSVSISFNVTNNDSTNSINWVKISRPSSRYSVTGGSGWTASVSNPDSVTFTGGTITAGSSQSFSLNIDTSPLATGNQNWAIDSSNDGGGSTTSCSGASTSISTDTTPPVISNIQTSGIGDNTATITWTSDKGSTSVVDYGTSVSYGSNKNDGSLVTSHSVNLTGLSAGTTYHFKVTSADVVRNSSSSGDNTFTTTGTAGSTPVPSASANPSSSPSGSGSSSSSSSSSSPSSSSSSSTTVATITPADTQPPTVSISNDFSKPLKSVPVLTGTASDNVGVVRVEYSTDAGKDWLPANFSNNLPTTNFSAVLRKLEDGNYTLIARAIDQAGNIGFSKQYLLIIDQIPPLIGANLFTVGPQFLLPQNEQMVSLAGVDQKITLSSIGGATKVTLIASSSGSLSKQFDFQKNPDNGLWYSVFNLADAGVFKLSAQAIDGAGNIVTKALNSINILQNGQISGDKGVVMNAQIEVYYFDDVTQRFILWDGKTYSQQNPQTVDSQGKYTLLLPPGKYYLQIQASGFRTIKTSIFSLSEFGAINQNFKMIKKWTILGLTLPDFNQDFVQINLPFRNANHSDLKSNLIGTQLFDFSLTDGGQTVNSAFLNGKPTVITFLNSWLPQTAQQLNNLETVNQNTELQTLVIFPLESASFIDSFKAVGDYQLPIFADPEGKLVQKLDLPMSPSHLFVDRKGIIRQVKTGLLSADEITKNLIN